MYLHATPVALTVFDARSVRANLGARRLAGTVQYLLPIIAVIVALSLIPVALQLLRARRAACTEPDASGDAV